jgi:16S rRNA (cytidine1402-2'-O)-methyltransferase
VNSGLAADRFTFEGFLPVKKGRQTRMKELVEESRTMIFYESPHRLLKTLEEFAMHFGPERKASVSRELTKLFEETKRGTLEEIKQHFETHTLKGEIVICVAGK